MVDTTKHNGRSLKNEKARRMGTAHFEGAYVVAVKWFTWDNGRTTEEYVSELELMSEV